MTTRLISVLVFSSLIFSCNKSSDPVSPEEPPKRTMTLDAYGEIIDTLYFKIWSDSSWTEYSQTTTINGITYVTIITNSGNEYYYSALGYAGFKPTGQSLILFDKPLPGLPDTLVFGETYTRQTTFFFQGYNYTLKFEQSLQDTVSVSVPIGIFNPCLHFSSKSTLSAGGQSDIQNSQFWLAQGPGDIKETLNSGATIVLVRAKVNGQGWNMPYPKIGSTYPRGSSQFAEALINPLPVIKAASWRWLTGR